MITDYLVSLHTELQIPRRRRARALAEVEDHLLCAVAELRADGVPLDVAEAKAIEAFGDPGELARGLNAVEDRRRTVRAGWLALPLGLGCAWLGLRGVLGLDAPFPVALTAFVLAQVALVTGGLTALRAWLLRAGGEAPLLLLIRRGSVLVTGCGLALGGLATVTAASHGTSLSPPAVVLSAAMLGMLVTACWALPKLAGSSDSSELPEDHDVLAELRPIVGTNAITRAERWISLRRRPWRFAVLVSLAAGLALAAAHGAAEGGPANPATVPGALLAAGTLLGIETLASLGGFLVLGRWLGIRPARMSILPK